MQYRVAVAYQNGAWDKGNTELTNLFTKIKEEEMFRRMNLREYLVAFVQRQERMFATLPGLNDTVLNDLMGKEMTKEQLKVDVEAAIAAKTEKVNKSQKTSSATPFLTAKNDQELEQIASPLSSDLMIMAKVVLRKGIASANGIERTSLGVVTSDYYLHMFDVPPEKCQLGDTPESAFEILTPKVVSPSAENFMSGVSNFNKGWCDSLVLSDSIILGNATVQRKDDFSFEMLEVVETKGASKMFVKSAKKKVLISTASKEETDEWISHLTK